MRVSNITSLGQVAKFLSTKGDKKVVAKKIDGQVHLFTRDHSSKADKFRLKFYNGSIMTRATYKKELAKDTISALIVKNNNVAAQKFETAARRLGIQVGDVNSLRGVLNSAHMLTNDKSVRADKLVGTFGAMQRLTEHVTSILNRVELPVGETTMPQTANGVGQGTVPLWLPKTKADREFPILNIDGKDYTPEQVQGEGGNGVVVRYRNGQEILAVKLPVPGGDPEVQREKALKEYHMAARLTAGNPNVFGFDKIIPLGDGFVAIAGKLAPHGDLEKLRDKLNTVTVDTGDPNIPAPPGKISKRDRQIIALTLLQDAASGLDKVNSKGNSIHGDVKTQNVMINKDGRAVMIDLGESKDGGSFNPYLKQLGDNHIYLAPEVLKVRDESFSLDAKKQKLDWNSPLAVKNKHEVGALIKDFAMQQGWTESAFLKSAPIWEQATKGLAEDIEEAHAKVELEKRRVDTKVDVWGLGTIAFELMVGERYTEEKLEGGEFTFEHEKTMKSWSETGNFAIGSPGGLTSKSTGDGRLDFLINGMLDPNPERRFSASEVKNNPLITQTTGVGSSAVRQLIKAIVSEDADQITAARHNLARFMGTV